MKLNELTIEDYVRFDGEICTIDELRVDGTVVLISQYTDLADGLQVDIDEVEPIEITHEILKHNGFGHINVDYDANHKMRMAHYYLGEPHYLANPDLLIGTMNNEVFWLVHTDNTIYGLRYVHQLQHALRLCGIEKEIVL